MRLAVLLNAEKIVDKTDFNGKPIKKVQFIVVDPRTPSNIRISSLKIKIENS